MTGSRHVQILAALFCGALTLAWTVSAEADVKRTPQLEQLIKDAQADGELNVVWGGASLGEAAGVKAIEAALNRTFGTTITINYTPGPSMPQMSARVIQEVKAGQKASTDAFIGIEVSIPAMVAAHVLEPVPWAEYFPEITPEMVTKGGEAVQVFTLFNGMSYNVNLIPPDKVPHTIAEAMRPEWKGKLASTPYAAGFDRLGLAYGDEKIRPVVEKMAQWAGGLIRCGDYDRLASGEFIALILDCGAPNPPLMVENGGPIKLVPLDDALATTITYLAVPKTSEHPNLAKLFAGFLATHDGQALIEKYGSTSHLVPGTPAYKLAQSFAARGLKLLAYTPDTIAPRLEEAGRYKAEYEKILQGK
jgi:ABC-type Fe3+ transport system substrate-binding protein